jgi:excinuclease UvrABC nuclease subunit
MMESFVEFKGTSGVYLLLRQGEVVYAGQSVNVYRRLQMHWRRLREVQLQKRQYAFKKVEVPYIEFDSVRIKEVDEGRLDAEEFALIQHFQPVYNVLLNRAVNPIEAKIATLPCIQAIIEKARARGAELKRRRIR